MKLKLLCFLSLIFISHLIVGQTVEEKVQMLKFVELRYKSVLEEPVPEEDILRADGFVPKATINNESKMDYWASQLSQNARLSMDGNGLKIVPFQEEDSKSSKSVQLRTYMVNIPHAAFVKFEVEWKSAKNHKGEEILNLKTKGPNPYKYSFGSLFAPIPIVLKQEEGPIKDVIVTGNLKMMVPREFEILSLNRGNIGKQFIVGSSKVELLSLEKNRAVLRLDGNDEFNITPVNKDRVGFDNTTNLYMLEEFYQALKEGKELKEEELASIAKKLDLNTISKKGVRFMQVSGKLEEILMFKVKSYDEINIPITAK
jgi:hypothetical protein